MAPDESCCRPYPWHAEAWEQLCRNVQGGRQHHALLIEGAPGTGRRVFADAAAALLLCSDARADGNCGECRACQLRVAGSHSDLFTVAPEEEGRAIGVDAIRGAITFANGTATLGKRKVLLLSPAQDLTTAAFNAFLKSLEEPAPGTFMLLVTARGHPLPATIRSRCQRVALPDPADDAARDWLDRALAKSDSPPARDQVAAILRLAPRRPLEALRLHEGSDGKAAIALDAALHADPGERLLERVEQAARQIPPDRLVDIVEHALRVRLRSLSVDELRSSAGIQSLASLVRLETLRGARRAGQNPNAELLRSEVVAAFVAGQGD